MLRQLFQLLLARFVGPIRLGFLIRFRGRLHLRRSGLCDGNERQKACWSRHSTSPWSQNNAAQRGWIVFRAQEDEVEA